jgi:predicted nucleic acid-binding protein
MHLSDLKNGSSILIDSNIFVYHFFSKSRYNPAASEFLERVEKEDIVGITLTSIIMETTHRMMILEAAALFPDIRPRDLVAYLKEHPERVKQLTDHQAVPTEIASFNVQIISPDLDMLKKSQEMKKRFGFLSNDALTLQVMEDHKIANLASNDGDFERVDFVNLYRPAAVPSE